MPLQDAVAERPFLSHNKFSQRPNLKPAMKITSWNINSFKARQGHVLDYIRDNKPDVLMMQELKGLDFPASLFEDSGFHTISNPQKAYNGVAVLSKRPFETVRTSLPGFEEDEQARFIEIAYPEFHLINVYCPNGNPVPSDKYSYKIKWMGHLKNHLDALLKARTPFIIGGDFNVIPEGRDCYSPQAWEGDALFLPQTRQIYRSLLNLGLTEAYRALHPNQIEYTFWDYQAGAWPQNKGIRIDHFLLSPSIADSLENCRIEKTPRGWDKPSDHTPIEMTIDAGSLRKAA